MRLELTGRHVEITPALRRLVNAKVAKLDRLLNDSAVSAQVVLKHERHEDRIEFTVHARGERFLHGAGSASTWNGSLAEAMDKITQQALTLKGKLQERKRRPVAKTATPADDVPAAAPAPRPRARARMPRVVRASRQALRLMSVADAMRAVEDTGDGVVIFRDAETAAISVLVRHHDGELTLVEAEL